MDYLMQLTIARAAMADNISELVDDLKQTAKLPERDYLESEMDKNGLEALKSQLVPKVKKKV